MGKTKPSRGGGAGAGAGAGGGGAGGAGAGAGAGAGPHQTRDQGVTKRGGYPRPAAHQRKSPATVPQQQHQQQQQQQGQASGKMEIPRMTYSEFLAIERKPRGPDPVATEQPALITPMPEVEPEGRSDDGDLMGKDLALVVEGEPQQVEVEMADAVDPNGTVTAAAAPVIDGTGSGSGSGSGAEEISVERPSGQDGGEAALSVPHVEETGPVEEQVVQDGEDATKPQEDATKPQEDDLNPQPQPEIPQPSAVEETMVADEEEQEQAVEEVVVRRLAPTMVDECCFSHFIPNKENMILSEDRQAAVIGLRAEEVASPFFPFSPLGVSPSTLCLFAPLQSILFQGFVLARVFTGTVEIFGSTVHASASYQSFCSPSSHSLLKFEVTQRRPPNSPSPGVEEEDPSVQECLKGLVVNDFDAVLLLKPLDVDVQPLVHAKLFRRPAVRTCVALPWVCSPPPSTPTPCCC